MTRIAVVGSANLDVVVPVDRHPGVGETVLGGDHSLIPGGKGANQAVAASRLGAQVALVGRLGRDAGGAILRESIEAAGVDTTYLAEDEAAPSGLALITVGPNGDNTIVVSPGANARVGIDDIERAEPVLGAARVLLTQLEVPMAAIVAASRSATGTVVLDPAPAPTALPHDLLDVVDVIVPNETELAVLTGQEHAPDGVDALIGAARRLTVATVVVTLGGRGALLVHDGGAELFPAPSITPVDTTGAGDAFRAALAVGIGSGLALDETVAWAVRVGAAACLRPGAQPSMPTPSEVETLLAKP